MAGHTYIGIFSKQRDGSTKLNLSVLTVYDELPLVLQGRVGELRVLGSTGHRLSVVGGSRPEHQRGDRHVSVVQKLDGTTRVFFTIHGNYTMFAH